MARERAGTVYRDAILAAAEAEFADRGYATVRMLDIARRAGMSVGALYRHFESKEEIFQSLLERASERVILEMRAVTAANPEPRARITRLIETVLRFIEDNQGMFLVLHQLVDTDRARCGSMVERADSIRSRMLALYRAALADGVAAGTLTDDVCLEDQLAFVTGATHGFLDAWFRAGGQTGLVDKAPIIARLVLRALGGRS